MIRDLRTIMVSSGFKKSLRMCASREDLSIAEFTRRNPDLLLKFNQEKKEDKDDKKKFPYFKV